MDALVSACGYVSDAHAAGDAGLRAATLCELYRVLAARGWVVPRRVTSLLHVQAAAFDAELWNVVELQPGGPARSDSSSSGTPRRAAT